MTGSHRAYVVVGVVPRQPSSVVEHAAVFATRFGAELVCAHVAADRYAVDESEDGSVHSFPIDPDLPDERHGEFDPALLERLERILVGRDVTWSVRSLAGDPARALGHLGDTLGAAMIVVGTREATIRAGFQEFFGGSVAVHLAHRQHRPVVVVPLAPRPFDNALPWDPA